MDAAAMTTSSTSAAAAATSNLQREVTMPNFNNRCAITPTTFSNYMKNLGHISSSVSASPLVIGSSALDVSATPLSGATKFDMFSARQNFRAALLDSSAPAAAAAAAQTPSQNRYLIEYNFELNLKVVEFTQISGEHLKSDLFES